MSEPVPADADAKPASAQPAAPTDAIISLRDVYKSFGKLKVLRGISLDFQTGHTTVIIGPSGCGKSVMLKLIVELLHPDRGQVLFDGKRIDHFTERELNAIRTQFGFLFQMGALFDSMNVSKNIAFPLTEHSDIDQAGRDQRVTEVLALIGMSGTEKKMPAELSGGQRKRIALGRAIALKPRVILYDEPTTGLDPIRSDVINELIIKLKRELKVTSIVVTHDMASAYKIADRMVMIYDGKIVANGTPDEIRKSEHPIVRGFVEGRSDIDMAGLEAKLD